MPLRARVGRHTKQGRRQCQNWLDDQNYVITLLNGIPSTDGGAGGTLDGRIGGRMIAGMAGDRLYAAITRFEDMHFPLQRSGFVDPGGRMLNRMEGLVAMAAAAWPIPDARVPPPETTLDRTRRFLLSSMGYHLFTAQERKDFEPLDEMALKHVDRLQNELRMKRLPWEIELFGRAHVTRNKLARLQRDGSITFTDLDSKVTTNPPLPEMRFGQPVEYLDDITTAKLGALLLYNGGCCRVPPFSEARMIGSMGSSPSREPVRLYRP